MDIRKSVRVVTRAARKSGKVLLTLFGVFVLLIVINLAALGAATAGVKGDNSGGASYCNQSGEHMDIGSNCVKVWHTGHYPIAGVRDYEFGCTWSFSYGHKRYPSFDSKPTVSCYTAHEAFVTVPAGNILDSATEKTGIFYRCDVQGKSRAQGCFFGKVKVPIVVKLPVKGEFRTVYPWVYVRLGADGEVIVADHMHSIW